MAHTSTFLPLSSNISSSSSSSLAFVPGLFLFPLLAHLASTLLIYPATKSAPLFRCAKTICFYSSSVYSSDLKYIGLLDSYLITFGLFIVQLLFIFGRLSFPLITMREINEAVPGKLAGRGQNWPPQEDFLDSRVLEECHFLSLTCSLSFCHWKTEFTDWFQWQILLPLHSKAN